MEGKWIEPIMGKNRFQDQSQLRKQFSIGKKVISATAYITRMACMKAQLNAQE